MAKTKRQQSADAESQVNTRQDRNTFVVDGGIWSWDAGTGTLGWSGTIRISRAGVAPTTIATGSLTGITAPGDTAYLDVDRAAGGSTSLVTDGLSITSSTNNTDNRVVLGVRGTDGRFYMRNGTVLSDSDSKMLGQLNTATDRSDSTANGSALQGVGFTFVAGANQLAVYVGGLLQTEGVDYVETGTTQVTFQAGSIPTAGEALSFMNVVGGEGPAATGTVSLADAWAVGNAIDVTSGDIMRVYNTDGAAALAVDDAATGTPTFLVNGNGNVIVSGGSAGYSFQSNAATEYWSWLPIDNGGSAAMFVNTGNGRGLAVSKTSGLLEFGQYTGTFPGGSWAGDGGLRWSVYMGTLNAGVPTDIATGLADILGISFAVLNGATGLYVCWASELMPTASRGFGVSFNPSTGVIRIADDTLGAATGPGADVDGEAYRLVVFHRG